MFADHRPGGRGVVIAVLDTGVAYRNWEGFRKSPDFGGTHFVDPYDFVAGNAFPLDREGHGTFVAGMIAEATNNGRGLTGLAYGAKIMPVRVLDADGDGDSVTIARGIRYAVKHGAQVINLSLEFDISVRASQIPDIISAINFAHRHGVVVVAAAGNDSSSELAYPAAAPLGDLGRRDDARPLPGRILERRREARPGGAGRRRRRRARGRPRLPSVPQPAARASDDVPGLQLARPRRQSGPVRLPRQLRHVDGRARGVGDRGAGDRQPESSARIPRPTRSSPTSSRRRRRSAARSRTRTTATAWSTPARRPRRFPGRPRQGADGRR